MSFPRTVALLAAIFGVLIAMGVMPMPAKALAMSSTSEAYGLSMDLSIDPPLLPPTNFVISPYPHVAGAAPSAYDESQIVLDAFVGTIFSSDTLSVHAGSNVDGAPGDRFATANATLEGASLFISKLLSLSFTTVYSTATVATNALPHGEAMIEGSLELFGLGIFDLPASPAPNTEFLSHILNPLGITILLNEQVFTEDGDDQYLSVNAIRILFDGALAGLNTVNGEVIFSHSEANMLMTPEPTTGVMLGLGMLGLAFHGRRRE